MDINIDSLNALIARLPNGFGGCNNHVLVSTNENNLPTVDGIVIAMPTADPSVNILYKLLIDSNDIEVFSSPSTVDLSQVNVIDLQTVDELYTDIYKHIAVLKYNLIVICIQHFINMHHEQVKAGTYALDKIYSTIKPVVPENANVSAAVETTETTENTVTDKPAKKKTKTRKTTKKTTKKSEE